MDLGLQEALRLLEVHGDPDRSQYVLLLTDGEPTAPLQVTGQKATITNLVAQIEDAGALLYPVILCNPDAGCAGDFLKTSSPLAREAKSSQDLLLIFSELFAEMKSDRSVVTHRNVQGNLTISIRNAHGAGSIAFVSPQSAITAVERGRRADADTEPACRRQHRPERCCSHRWQRENGWPKQPT